MDSDQNETCSILKKYRKLKVYLSGYGPFMTIRENPSQKLVESLINNKDLIHAELNNLCEIVHDSIYEVSVDYVCENITHCHTKIEDELVCGNCNELFLIIHFGVNDAASEMNLETKATNYIRDYCKYKGKINEDGAENYECKLDLHEIAKDLKTKKHKISLNNDAGTYLCNFIYYKSLEKFSACDNVRSLFIHIPKPEVYSVEDCHKCFVDFLKCVTSKYIA